MINIFRRVCFFGGPGTAKSTQAAYVYSQLKKHKKSVELVQEYVKSWAYENRKISSFDQLYLLAKQIRLEDLVLRHDVDLVVTDSPVLMSTCYAKAYGFDAWKCLVELAKKFEEQYPSVNIFLSRGNIEYKSHGRYQTKEEAIEFDNLILRMLEESDSDFSVVDCRDSDKIMNVVMEKINGEKNV